MKRFRPIHGVLLVPELVAATLAGSRVVPTENDLLTGWRYFR